MNELILLDIFSYSCMNCIRSFEFIRKINDKYKKYGLETIIIHPPEWHFEKKCDNILRALRKFKINLPVIIDKNQNILRKFKINFWPAQILLRNGRIVYKHIGEGNYKKLENNIAAVLKIKSKRIFSSEPVYSKFPALYCGKKKKGKIQKLNKKLRFGVVYIDNNWIQKREFIESIGDSSSLAILAKGKIVNFVAESINKRSIKINIKLNNKKIKAITAKNPQLYKIMELKNENNQELILTASKNLAIYSFSFQ